MVIGKFHLDIIRNQFKNQYSLISIKMELIYEN